MNPEVMHLIVCEDVRPDPNNYHRLNIHGLVTTIRSTAYPPFPVIRPELVVLVIWVGGRGAGPVNIRITESAPGTSLLTTPSRKVRFVGDPTAVGGAVFRVKNCVFRTPGVNWVEVVFSGSVIGRQRLHVKAREDFDEP